MMKPKTAWNLSSVILRFLLGAVPVGHVLNLILKLKIYFSVFRKDDPSLHWILWFVVGLIAGCFIYLFGGAAVAPGGTHGKLDAWAGRPNAGWYSLSVLTMTSALLAAFYLLGLCLLWRKVEGDDYLSVPLNKGITITFMIAILLGIVATWIMEWRMHAPDKPKLADCRSHGKLP